jgi:hypothetical protein
MVPLPETVWEVTSGVYLIVKGFTSSATRRDAAPRRGTQQLLSH